jgi:hypothetical protein
MRCHDMYTKLLLKIKRLQCYSFFLLFIFLVSFSGCSKKNIVSPEEIVSPVDLRVPQSTIFIPLKIERAAVQSTAQKLLDNLFSEGLPIEGGYVCYLSTADIPDIQATGDRIRFVLPIQVDIRSGSRWAPGSAGGSIELILESNIGIAQNKMQCSTELIKHRWLVRPALKIAGVQLPIESLANQLIKRYSPRMTKEIDRLVVSALDLGRIRTDLQRFFAKPVFSTDDNQLHVFSTPLELSLGFFRTTTTHIVLPAAVIMENVLGDYRPEHKLHLFAFSKKEVSTGNSNLALQARIPLNYVQNSLRSSLQGSSFQSPTGRINLATLDLSGQSKKLQVNFTTTGAFNGSFEMRFSPEFNAQTGKLYTSDFELKLVKGKGLSKTLYQLIRQQVAITVKKSLEEELNSFLNGYLQQASHLLARRAIYPGTFLSGELKGHDINQFWIQQGKLFFNFHLQMALKAELESIDIKSLKG